jgi:hypothetical protein
MRLYYLCSECGSRRYCEPHSSRDFVVPFKVGNRTVIPKEVFAEAEDGLKTVGAWVMLSFLLGSVVGTHFGSWIVTAATTITGFIIGLLLALEERKRVRKFNDVGSEHE